MSFAARQSGANMAAREIWRSVRAQGEALARYTGRLFWPAARAPIGRDPAFDPETRSWFNGQLDHIRSYLEYGAGASTLLVADRGIAAISIESDARYARQVSEALPVGLGTRIVPVDIGVTEAWGYPLWIFPTRAACLRWQRYPLAGPALLHRLPVFPELVLIDGRFRVASCLAMARAAIEHEASPQILFDDYSLRPHYRGVEAIIGEPEKIGRAALFRIEPAALDLNVLDAAIDVALRDYR